MAKSTTKKFVVQRVELSERKAGRGSSPRAAGVYFVIKTTGKTPRYWRFCYSRRRDAVSALDALNETYEAGELKLYANFMHVDAEKTRCYLAE